MSRICSSLCLLQLLSDMGTTMDTTISSTTRNNTLTSTVSSDIGSDYTSTNYNSNGTNNDNNLNKKQQSYMIFLMLTISFSVAVCVLLVVMISMCIYQRNKKKEQIANEGAVKAWANITRNLTSSNLNSRNQSISQANGPMIMPNLRSKSTVSEISNKIENGNNNNNNDDKIEMTSTVNNVAVNETGQSGETHGSELETVNEGTNSNKLMDNIIDSDNETDNEGLYIIGNDDITGETQEGQGTEVH